VDAKPVLPAAIAMELMAETVQEGWPDLEVAAVENLRILGGVVLDSGATEVRVAARSATQLSQDGLGLVVGVQITEANTPSRICYRASVRLTERLPPPPAFQPPPPSSLDPFPLSVQDAYRGWLFHGPRFQCISTIHGIDGAGILASVFRPSRHDCLADPGSDTWLIDPIVFDSGPQLASLWARARIGMNALPSGFKSLRRFAPLSDSSLTCYLRVLPTSSDHALLADVYFLGEDGRLLAVLENLESTCSLALNRWASLG
jgi:hypothetical protein